MTTYGIATYIAALIIMYLVERRFNTHWAVSFVIAAMLAVLFQTVIQIVLLPIRYPGVLF